MARPASVTNRVRFLPNLSLNQPPVGRAIRFIKAKLEAMSPACTCDISNVSRKNNGNIETTASSEPKVTR